MFLDNDHLVFRATDGSLQVGRLNADRTGFTSSPIPLVPNVLAAGSGGGSFSVASDGTLAYIAGGATGESRPVWVDATGREEQIPGLPSRIYGGVSLSPVGRRAAVTIGITGQSTDVWLIDLELGSMAPVTRDGRSSRPAWRRDGRTLNWLHFNSNLNEAARRGLSRENAGANLPPVVSTRNVDASSGEDSIPGRWPTLVDELAWSPDEKYLAIRSRDNLGGLQGTRNILVRRMDSDTLVPFAAEPAQERGPAFSVDGKWLAYVSDRSGRNEVYAESFPGGGNRVQISVDGGREAVWSRDGSRLFYRAPDGWMMAMHMSPGPTLQVTKRDRLFDASGYHTNEFLTMYDVARDGRFLMLKLESSGARTDVVIIRNWVQQVKSRLSEQR
jgi:Tol biopolymer transport system component